MIKQYPKKILLTSIVTLFPITIGLLLWNQLPDLIATHFNANNQPDGYSSKIFAVFGIPGIILVIHLIFIIIMSIDPKSKNINRKFSSVVLWICPFVSLLICNTLYGYTLGYLTDIDFLAGFLIGILFIVLGNFIPTIKPNYTIGFRVPWSLIDPDNWYHTHRFGGKCMVIGGILLVVSAAFLNMSVLLLLAIIPCFLPVIYSYLYYRKKIS